MRFPTFSGDASESVHEYTAEFKRVSKIKKLNDKEHLQLLQIKLDGHAQKWLNTLSTESVQSYTRFIQLFKERFCDRCFRLSVVTAAVDCEHEIYLGPQVLQEAINEIISFKKAQIFEELGAKVIECKIGAPAHDNETKCSFTSKEQVAENVSKPAGTEFEVFDKYDKIYTVYEDNEKVMFENIAIYEETTAKYSRVPENKVKNKASLKSEEKFNNVLPQMPHAIKRKFNVSFVDQAEKETALSPKPNNNSLKPQETPLLESHSDHITTVINNVWVFICTRAFVCALNYYIWKRIPEATVRPP